MNTDGGHYIRWLVENRCRNQRLLLKLHTILESNRDIISEDTVIANDFQSLVAIGFSLWRAVFLAEVRDDFRLFAKETETFLSELIQHNTVSYLTDVRCHHWSFVYYVNNARFRLKIFADENRLISKDVEISDLDLSPEDA